MHTTPFGRVLFIDGDMWEPFGQLAAALAQHGIASDHLTVPPRHWQGRYGHVLERRLFQRTATPVRRAVADGGHAAIDLPDVVRYLAADTLDIQVRDDLGYALLRQGAERMPGLNQRTLLESQTTIYDKWEMTQLAHAANVPVPHSWRLGSVSAPPFQGSYGDPTGSVAAAAAVMVKAPVGFGGQSVARATSLAQIIELADELRDRTGTEPFLQEYIGSEMVNVGGVARHGDILLAASYRPIPAQGNPYGPPIAIELTAHEQALESTRRLVAALGYHGIFTVDYVCDSAGQALFIDFNPRVFGSWTALQSLGVDIVGAYLATLGRGRGPTPAPKPNGQRADTLGPPPPDGDLRAWWTSTSRTIDNWRPWLGRRWAQQARARTTAFAAREYTRRLLPR